MTANNALPGEAITQTAFLRGEHEDLGDLFAAWEPHSKHIEPGVRSSHFSAWLAPFQSRDDAERALIDAGAILDQVRMS